MKNLLKVSRQVSVFGVLLLFILPVFWTCDRGVESAPPTSTIVFTNCTLIDGTGADPVYDARLVVDSGVILAVGPAGSTPLPRRSRIVNLGGATVLPGFINAHVHAGFNRSNLESWAQGGVTTVRDLAGPSSFAWKDEMAKDHDCALLVAAGPMVSVPNGYPLVPWGSPRILPVNSPEDARVKVLQLLNDGADIIKLAVESGQSFGRVIPTLSLEEATAAVQAAHEGGTVASAHVLVTQDLRRAVAAGVDDIAHMVTDYLPDSLVAVMTDRCMLWVPTLELWHHVGSSQRQAAIYNLSKYVQAGGSVALGTDYAGYDADFQMGMPILEMEMMLQAGMSPMQVIVAGTRNAALACSRLSDLGTLEAGKTADVLVIDGDPLADIHNLANVRLVMHRGVIIRNMEH